LAISPLSKPLRTFVLYPLRITVPFSFIVTGVEPDLTSTRQNTTVGISIPASANCFLAYSRFVCSLTHLLNSISDTIRSILGASSGERLAAEGVNLRLVSFPSWELFKEQDQRYRDLVLPPSIRKRLAVEAGISLGWHEWVGDGGDLITIDRYGASAPAGKIFEEFGFTIEGVIQKAEELLRRVE